MNYGMMPIIVGFQYRSTIAKLLYAGLHLLPKARVRACIRNQSVFRRA